MTEQEFDAWMVMHGLNRWVPNTHPTELQAVVSHLLSLEEKIEKLNNKVNCPKDYI